MITINILTRTGNREKYFSTLKKTISNQTYENIRHIKSNDNPECTYLLNEPDVFNVEKKAELGKAFYNLYLNEIAKNVTEGWVIILDDDCKITDNNFIENLATHCSNSNSNEVLIFQSKIDTVIIPKTNDFNKKLIRVCGIDMACFCIHHTVFEDIQFDERICGDFHFIKKVESDKKYTFKFIDIPVGLWANYNGCKHGK
jgi:GT2 family glycosyltransferase